MAEPPNETSSNNSVDAGPWSYARAGVSIDAGDELIRRIAPRAAATGRQEALGGLGGFAALTRLPAGYVDPVLVSGTDGVGTKLRLAIDAGQHDGIGQDLVAMCVNDVLVTGAEPFQFLDYYATGRLDIDVAERVIGGIADACGAVGVQLAGGETAEMPDHYPDGDYDLAGFCLGVVDHARLLTGAAVVDGQRLLGLASSGAHANGFSLIRKLLALDPAGAPPLDQLLTPTRLYVDAARAVGLALPDPAQPSAITAMAHITGGGLTENIPRMFRSNRLAAHIDLSNWTLPPLFQWLRATGQLAEDELLRTFNCGIGLVLCVPEGQVGGVTDALVAAGEQVIELGSVETRDPALDPTVRYSGSLKP